MSKSDVYIIVTILCLLFLFRGEPDVFESVKNKVIASMNDTGCATHIEMPDPKNLKRIDVYKGNE